MSHDGSGLAMMRAKDIRGTRTGNAVKDEAFVTASDQTILVRLSAKFTCQRLVDSDCCR